MNKTFSFIKDTFLKLVSLTYPHGFEDILVEDMIQSGIFPDNLEKDIHGNYFIKIGDSKTIFASHLDTACTNHTPVNWSVDKNMIVKTDGTTVLGADDKAGVTVMLHLINNNVPGLYYFFIGEEVGCIGSSAASSSSGDFFKKYDRIISFDRRGTNSIITHQSSKRCCSVEFADELAKQLNNSRSKNLFFKRDSGGVYTDSAEFVKLIPECTNVSVGYMNEHRNNETQDLIHLYKLSEACLDVDWENLPVNRDPNKVEYKEYNYGNFNRYAYYDMEDEWDDDYDALHEHDPYVNLDLPSWNGSIKKKRNKRGKRGKGRKGRVFYDMAGELSVVDTTKILDTFKDKFFMSDISRNELDILRYQFFDENDPEHLESMDFLDKICMN